MKRLTDVGEYGLHEWLKCMLAAESTDTLGFGDDCATLDLPADQRLLITTDRLPLGLSGEYGGKLVVIQSFSDIISKGGTPIAFLLNLFLPRSTSFEEFRDLVSGAKEEVVKYGARILGGDTKEDTKLTVVGIGLGLASPEELLTRSGARPGDLVAITLAGGERIGARWGQIVVETLKPSLPRAVRDELMRQYQQDIRLPFQEMLAAASTRLVTAAMDNSDGLGGSLQLIGRASGVAFVLDERKLIGILDPILPTVAAALDSSLVRFAFAPGYDWQCVMTVGSDRFEEVRAAVADAGGELVQIGQVVDGEGVTMVCSDGSEREISLFSDEKFKPHPWAEQPAEWLAHKLLL